MLDHQNIWCSKHHGTDVKGGKEAKVAKMMSHLFAMCSRCSILPCLTCLALILANSLPLTQHHKFQLSKQIGIFITTVGR